MGQRSSRFARPGSDIVSSLSDSILILVAAKRRIRGCEFCFLSIAGGEGDGIRLICSGTLDKRSCL